eukprot:4073426-Prymnesium_polylepis.1
MPPSSERREPAQREASQLGQLQLEASSARQAAAAVAGPLADGWQEATSADGTTFYVHKATNATQWERP